MSSVVNMGVDCANTAGADAAVRNVVKATIDALEQLCDKNAIADMRGLPVERL